jgi:hypothetical protein
MRSRLGLRVAGASADGYSPNARNPILKEPLIEFFQAVIFRVHDTLYGADIMPSGLLLVQGLFCYAISDTGDSKLS